MLTKLPLYRSGQRLIGVVVFPTGPFSKMAQEDVDNRMTNNSRPFLIERQDASRICFHRTPMGRRIGLHRLRGRFYERKASSFVALPFPSGCG